MARLVLSAGQTAARALSQIGPAAARWAAQTAISHLSGGRTEGPRVEEIPIQTSTDGAAMAKVFGRARLAGQVIWASRFVEQAQKTSAGGKGGGPSQVDYTYSISFAVGLCEGDISGIGRIWANGALLDPSRYAFRIHTGGEDQLPDALIEAIEGADAPAFRGTAYVVFEDLPLDEFGYRIPNLSFEVFRPVREGIEPSMEERITGVNLIPGSGEFSYASEPVMRILGPGRETAENQHSGRGVTDFIAAIDDLQRDLPNCKSVQLIVSWFGNDLRCGSCLIQPGIEGRDKQTRPDIWSVAGQDRASAYLISQQDGKPVYGGTPSDASVIAAIKALKSRGFKVSLYPFILMDVPAGNGLADPYGGAEQAVFPWRGRITCHPAAGQVGTADGTVQAETQIASLFNASQANNYSVSGESVAYSGPANWGLNRFILHCAALAKAAGGVDGFLISSEMVALTTIRGASGQYPAVDQLKLLAAEARSLLGPSTRLSYAADWSEYSGHQPGGGEKIFHLDPLWSDANIDAVAIDWYVPLSDWREGDEHLDKAIASGPHDTAYLTSQIEGGEGYDWYYASQADRDGQVRTAISGDIYGEDWIWRYKDLASWWGQAHHDRLGGVRSVTPTSWQAQSKPIWLTEIGCPAIDKGANQPNVFVDPKSSESLFPYYSTGVRDDLIQRRYIEAMTAYWDVGAGNNPISSVYGANMIDTALTHVWAYDVRPWPDFPARSDIWADGENWRLGHWLNGRVGLVPVAGIVREVCKEARLDAFDVSRLDDLIAGYQITGPVSGRRALEPLAQVLGFEVYSRFDGVHFVSAGRGEATPFNLQRDGLDASFEFQLTQTPPFEMPLDLRLSFIDDMAEYRPGQSYARMSFGNVRVASWQAPVLCDPDLARTWCQAGLEDLHRQSRLTSFALPPSALALETGDVVSLNDETMNLCALEGADSRRASVCAQSARTAQIRGGLSGVGTNTPILPARPELAVLDLPLLEDTQNERDGPLLAAFAEPWPGALSIDVQMASGLFENRVHLSAPAVMGQLTSDLPPGPIGRWDSAGSIAVEIYGGVLESVETLDVLNGANICAIETSPDEWEIIQFANAVLTGERAYHLTNLLRGQKGSDASFGASIGARVVFIESGLDALSMKPSESGLDVQIRAVPSGLPNDHVQIGQTSFVWTRSDLKPYAPVHVRASHVSGSLTINWIRQSRIGGDDWRAEEIALGEAFERYRLELMLGEAVLFSDDINSSQKVFSDSELIAIYGALPISVDVRIAQISERYGPGSMARHVLDL